MASGADTSKVKWIPVSSTVVRAMAFETHGIIVRMDGASTARYGTMYICFHTGGVYEYHPVLEYVFAVILEAESIGAALARCVPRHLGRKVGVLQPTKEASRG